VFHGESTILIMIKIIFLVILLYETMKLINFNKEFKIKTVKVILYSREVI
jgi:hypothetical protein